MIDMAVRGTDIAIIVATMLGPILAVQAQAFLDKRRIVTAQRLTVFRALMATRSSILSPTHVEALNSVPVEFFGDSAGLRAITDRWKLYLDHLGTSTMPSEMWAQRRNDLMTDLLYAMSSYLGYRFSRSQLERDVYSPTAHGTIETEQNAIRIGLARIFRGESAFPVFVHPEEPRNASDPVPPVALKD